MGTLNDDGNCGTPVPDVEVGVGLLTMKAVS